MVVEAILSHTAKFVRNFTREFLFSAGPVGFLAALEQEFIPVLGPTAFHKLIIQGAFSKVVKPGLKTELATPMTGKHFDFIIMDDVSIDHASPYMTDKSAWFTGDFKDGDFDWNPGKFKVTESFIEYVAPKKQYSFEKHFYQESRFGTSKKPIIKIPRTFQVYDDGEVLLPLFP